MDRAVASSVDRRSARRRPARWSTAVGIRDRSNGGCVRKVSEPSVTSSCHSRLRPSGDHTNQSDFGAERRGPDRRGSVHPKRRQLGRLRRPRRSRTQEGTVRRPLRVVLGCGCLGQAPITGPVRGDQEESRGTPRGADCRRRSRRARRVGQPDVCQGRPSGDHDIPSPTRPGRVVRRRRSEPSAATTSIAVRRRSPVAPSATYVTKAMQPAVGRPATANHRTRPGWSRSRRSASPAAGAPAPPRAPFRSPESPPTHRAERSRPGREHGLEPGDPGAVGRHGIRHRLLRRVDEEHRARPRTVRGRHTTRSAEPLVREPGQQCCRPGNDSGTDPPGSRGRAFRPGRSPRWRRPRGCCRRTSRRSPRSGRQGRGLVPQDPADDGGQDGGKQQGQESDEIDGSHGSRLGRRSKERDANPVQTPCAAAAGLDRRASDRLVVHRRRELGIPPERGRKAGLEHRVVSHGRCPFATDR